MTERFRVTMLSEAITADQIHAYASGVGELLSKEELQAELALRCMFEMDGVSTCWERSSLLSSEGSVFLALRNAYRQEVD